MNGGFTMVTRIATVVLALTLTSCTNPFNPGSYEGLADRGVKGLDTYYGAEYNHTQFMDIESYDISVKSPKDRTVVEKFDLDGNLISRTSTDVVVYDTTTSSTGTVHKRVVRGQVKRSIPYQRKPVVSDGLITNILKGLGFVANYYTATLYDRRNERMHGSLDLAIENAAPAEE
jgi:hypothetical protein